MISKPVHDVLANDSREQSQPSGLRWPLSMVVLIALGWIWPYAPSSVLQRLSDSGWMLGWLTVLVLIGAAAGYVLRSRWAVVLTPVCLYAGGAVHWFQYEWGFTWPVWEDFLAVTAIALGVLLLTSGLAAGVACRVVSDDPRPHASQSDTARLAAAMGALLGLFALTAINVLPFPYLGGLLGFAAVLSGITVMQESKVTSREHLLAIVGMLFGVFAVVSQVYSLWSWIQDL